MAKIQFNIPKEIIRQLKLERIEGCHANMAKLIVSILEERYKENLSEHYFKIKDRIRIQYERIGNQ